MPPQGSAPCSLTPVKLTDLSDWSPVRPAIEDVFFEASGRTFEPGPERDAFRERWLDRYLDRWPELAFVLPQPAERAAAAAPGIAGYLVGCLEDPARTPLFADLAYFHDFAGVTCRFPAHLHINLAPDYRGLGLGGRLVAAFAADVRAAGLPGMHVVTAPSARNVGFYARLGFTEVARTLWLGKPVVLLGHPFP